MKRFAASLLVVFVLFSATACTGVSPATVSGEQTAASAPETSVAGETADTSASSQSAETEPADYEQLGDELMNSDSIGTVKRRMTESELIAALGQPDARSDVLVWGTDGMKHSDWSYRTLGLLINMIQSDNAESEYTVFSITAKSPCTLSTQKGIKIGDTKEAVLTAYGYAVQDSSDEGTRESIIVGSVYGGIVFGMENGAVISIFIGSAAE